LPADIHTHTHTHTYIRTHTHAYIFDVCGSVHHSTIRTENPARYTVYQNFIFPYLYEAQHVSGDTPPIIRSLKLH